MNPDPFSLKKGNKSFNNVNRKYLVISLCSQVKLKFMVVQYFKILKGDRKGLSLIVKGGNEFEYFLFVRLEFWLITSIHWDSVLNVVCFQIYD